MGLLVLGVVGNYSVVCVIDIKIRFISLPKAHPFSQRKAAESRRKVLILRNKSSLALTRHLLEIDNM
jgi:hypothetical protein